VQQLVTQLRSASKQARVYEDRGEPISDSLIIDLVLKGTVEKDQPTHGKFKTHTGQQVAGLVDTVHLIFQDMKTSRVAHLK
jgi:hypothetical protein